MTLGGYHIPEGTAMWVCGLESNVYELTTYMYCYARYKFGVTHPEIITAATYVRMVMCDNVGC